MAARITEAERRELREKFALFDEDSSGYIEKVELRNILQVMGQNPTQEEVERIVREADVIVRDGRIDFEEFVRIVKTSFTFKTASEMDNELLAAFQVFDRDKNGLISRHELQHVLTSIGEPLTDHDIDEMFRSADANEDGHISYREFVSMFNQSLKEAR